MWRMLTRLPAALAALALLWSLAACGEETGTDPGSEAPSSQAAASGETCHYPTTGGGAVGGVEPPPAEPTVSGTVEVAMETSAGPFSLSLDAESTPCTVNSFASLVEQDYYDGTSCHRLTAYEGGQGDLKVLQCGDPTGSGGGGPGYTIPDELSGEETYPAGTLAMAKTSQPDSGGSQFFIVYGDSTLPPDYTVFGTVDDGTVETVAEIAADGSTPPTDGRPNTPVDIESATME